MITVDEVVAELRSRRDERALAGMARYGIKVDDACGVSVPEVRALGKRIVKELGRRNPARHPFALDLWVTGIHEARLLAGLVDLPEMVTEGQMETWVADLDSWDVCDQLCNNLFTYAPQAWPKALEWSGRDEEFVKRAGFVLMATLAVHDKGAPDERFLPLLAAIEREAPTSATLSRRRSTGLSATSASGIPRCTRGRWRRRAASPPPGAAPAAGWRPTPSGSWKAKPCGAGWGCSSRPRVARQDSTSVVGTIRSSTPSIVLIGNATVRRSDVRKAALDAAGGRVSAV